MALPTCGAGAFGACLRLRLTKQVGLSCALSSAGSGCNRHSFIVDMDIAFWQVIGGAWSSFFIVREVLPQLLVTEI